MYYYKKIENEEVIEIGTHSLIVPSDATEITEEEYNNILSIIQNKPKDTETHYYILHAGTLEYEAIERPEPIPIPEPTYTLDEAATILAQEVSQNGYDA